MCTGTTTSGGPHARYSTQGRSTHREELRTLIEVVHGPSAPQVPEPLERAQIDHDGARLGETALAQQNVVTPEDGYLKGTKGGVWSDEQFPHPAW